MNELASPPPPFPLIAPPGPSRWLIAASIAFTLAWIITHIGLFYFTGIIGMLMEMLLWFLRAIFLPGSTQPQGEDIFTWVPSLRLGLILTGAAGVPAGLAFFWRERRRVLWKSFALVFVAGVFCEGYSFWIFLSNAVAGNS